jgi:hypothetical protein
MSLAASWPIWLSPWEWSSSDWAGLTFVVIVAAAVVAWRQVKEARRLREDQRRLREEQARPFVLIDFHPWSTIIELKITNTGRTLARDVRFAFDPPLTTTHDTSGRGDLMELNVFKTGIPSLAPGKEITLFFDQFPTRIEKGLPLTYNVQVSYKDPAGKPYSEPTVLDLSMYLGTGGVTRHDIHDVHKRLKEIADSMRRWTDFSGLKVMTRADIERRNEEREARYAEIEAAENAATNDSGASNDSPA